MTDDNKRNVLVIGVDAATFGKVAPVLERETFEVDRFPRASASLELLSVIGFKALIVHYPLAEMSLQDFLDEVRKKGSLNRATPLLLLCDDNQVEAAREYIGRGANRVVSIADSAESLQSEVSRLLQVAKRVAVRVIASLEIQLAEGTTLALCQTENVSATGMLVRTTVGYPLGTRLSFEFQIPGEGVSVEGEAEVVRQTTVGREKTRGVGVRFLKFKGDGEERFRRHLEGL